MIEFGPQICHDFDAATKKEWLETNGIGGYASSTVALANTRRYHGLLVAALNPPLGRAVLLAKLDDSLLLRGDRYDLSTNQYPEIIYPQGHEFLERFRLDPFPVFTYRLPGATLEKSLFLVQGENTLVVIYRLAGEARAQLEVRPLLAFRGFHDLAAETESLNRIPRDSNGLLTVEPFAGMPGISIAHGGAFRSEGYWYRNFEYVEEAYRGYEFREDLYSYGSWTRNIAPGKEIAVIVSTADAAAMDAFSLRERERERRAELVGAGGVAGDVGGRLALAADQLLVRRKDHLASVIAGYHWFAEGSRDAAIALPGLAISTGRFDHARDVIRLLLMNVRRGLLPASFPRDGDDSAPVPAVDASLWLFVAVHEYLRASGDERFVREEVADGLLQILRHYTDGTDHGIHADGDGMIATAAPGVPLTWMSARVRDWIATEREGRPVEVAALWVNALLIGAEVAAIAGRGGERDRLARRGSESRAAFERLFWDARQGWLRDTLHGGGVSELRPNQVIALSLPHEVLGDEKARRVLQIVRERLWTPFGLRTLCADDARYRGRYVGDAWLREKAYHQGSVWPWLLGPYARALGRHGESETQAQTEIQAGLAFLDGHLLDAGVGAVSELFDGDEPHTPRGAISRCLSVAELLRVWKDAYAK